MIQGVWYILAVMALPGIDYQHCLMILDERTLRTNEEPFLTQKHSQLSYKCLKL